MDRSVPHEDAHRGVVKDELKRGSDVGVLANQVVAAGAAPTKAEYDALVTSHNKVLEVLRDSQLIPTT
jgi:hypothetical protein